MSFVQTLFLIGRKKEQNVAINAMLLAGGICLHCYHVCVAIYVSVIKLRTAFLFTDIIK